MSYLTFVLPDLGEGLTEAEIVRWLVAEGDLVAVDDCVVEVETAKSVVEVPTPYAGRVATLHAPEGATLQVGHPLISVDSRGPEEPPTVDTAERDRAESDAYREEERAGSGNVLIGYGTSAEQRGTRRRRRTDAGGAQPDARADPGRVPRVISPLVRRLARENGLDLASVVPSGTGGVIRKVDVERALLAGVDAMPVSPPQAVPPGPTGEHRIPLNGFRRSVAAALTRSRSEIPEATVWVDVDATALWEVRERARTPQDPGPGLLSYIARFVVGGLKQYPVLNARLDADRQEIVQHGHINLGIAVQSERGLVVPAVRQADDLTISRLDEEIRLVTARAREGRVTAEDLSCGTFTLNNYGGFRVDGSAAIINHPQVAILGLGRIIDRPWVVDGEVCVRKVTQLSFVFDHRVCDGGVAAGFMRSVADAIENPIAAMART